MIEYIITGIVLVTLFLIVFFDFKSFKQNFRDNLEMIRVKKELERKKKP